MFNNNACSAIRCPYILNKSAKSSILGDMATGPKCMTGIPFDWPLEYVIIPSTIRWVSIHWIAKSPPPWINAAVAKAPPNLPATFNFVKPDSSHIFNLPDKYPLYVGEPTIREQLSFTYVSSILSIWNAFPYIPYTFSIPSIIYCAALAVFPVLLS